jgi:hypothetical protein
MSFRTIIDVEVPSLLIDAPVPEVQPDLLAGISVISLDDEDPVEVPIELLLIDANVFNPNIGVFIDPNARTFFDGSSREFMNGDPMEFL